MKYKVPFVNYSLQYRNLKKEINEAIGRVLEGGDLILRQDVEKFEKKLADFVGTRYAVSLNSGTDALFFSLLAAGVGERAGGKKSDEVITVSHTFVASISAIVQAGAKPVLVDVKEDDYLMDIDELKKAITKRTKAVIPIHLNGRMCQMDKIVEIAKKRDLIVIEDAAQALGAKFNNKKAGSIGLTGCFSFYPAKILGCFGDGGAITTNDGRIAEKVRLFRDHCQKTKTQIVCFGWNSRLDNLQAAVLNIKLKYLPKWIKKRREIAEIYNKRLSKLADARLLRLPPAPENHWKDGLFRDFDVFQNYVLRAQKRDKLYYYLKERGVETLIKDPIPNHFQIGLNLSRFRLPVTEQLAKEVISLPMYPELTDSQINYIIKCVKDFYKS